MSLQYISSRNLFVQSCSEIWSQWNQSPLAARQFQREWDFSSAIRTAARFMEPPDLQFAPLGQQNARGAFSHQLWQLRLEPTSVANHRLPFENFLELCLAIYHETRHAEQFYRIAQGLLLGRLAFPDLSDAKFINSAQSSSSTAAGVQAKVALFGGGRVGETAVAATRIPTQEMVADLLQIPLRVAVHANSTRNTFDAFVRSPQPQWFKRSNLDTVEEWMRHSYKQNLKKMDAFAQRNRQAEPPPARNRRIPWLGRRANVYRMYRSLPAEIDAHQIEDWLAGPIYTRVNAQSGGQLAPNTLPDGA
jgi:hypothetical protein